MIKQDIDEAKKSYRKIARNILESNSIKPGSDSRLMKSIKQSSQDFVHNTGMIRLQDIDGIGPSREKKLASIGIWTPDDLYDEFAAGHQEELLALQQDDNGFTPKVISNAVSAAPTLPDEDVGNGFEKVTMIDGSEKLVKVSDIFGMFKKELEGKSLNARTEKPIRDMLTAAQEDALIDRFKKSNSLQGIRKVLEDAKKTFESAGIKPQPFATVVGGKISGRRINEIKDYIEKFGVDAAHDSIITLEERGSYLTHEVRDRICAISKDPSRCVKMVGLKEVAPAGRKKQIQDKILQLTKSDLRSNAENTVKQLLKRGSGTAKSPGTFVKLKVDEDELAEIAVAMKGKGLLRIGSVVAGKPVGRIYPSEKIIKDEILKSQGVVIGKTSNPRIADYLDFIHQSPKETYDTYMKRLMNMAGKAVYEFKNINRARLNLKIPIRKDHFSDDVTSASKILGYNIKTGLAPVGYDYKNPAVAEKFNTFNVLIRPPGELANKYHKATAVVNRPDNITFAFDIPSGFMANVGMTNVIKSDLGYVTTLCPLPADVNIQRHRALGKALSSASDAVKQRKISGITETGDGAMTAIYKLSKSVYPGAFSDIKGDTPVWNISDLSTRISRVVSHPTIVPKIRTVRDKMTKKASGTRVKFTNEEGHIRDLLTLKKRFDPVLKVMKESERDAKVLEDKQLAKAGTYNRRRRIGCTVTNQMKVDPDNKIFVKVPKASQAGKDITAYLSRACPTMDEKCIIDNLQFHQNITDNIGTGRNKDTIMARNVRSINTKYADPVDLDKAAAIVRSKVFRSGETAVGGKKETKRVLTKLERGGYTPLDLGKWSFIDKL